MTDAALVRALVAGRTDRAEEERLLDLLRSASAAELNEILTAVDTGNLFGSLDDRLVGPDHRTALRSLLTEVRLAELDVPARAAVLYGLQKGRTGRADEEAVERVFLATHGAELTRLKNTVNMRLDAHDLEGLVYRDVDHDDVRDRILAHLAAEAATVTPGKAKVLSDIDDTVFCALHDDRYPKGTLYPGVLALLDALDRGPTGEPFSTGDLTFVTARPSDALGLIENHTRSSLRKAGIAQSSVLTGSFLALHTRDAMATRKLANIAHYHALFDEYRLLWLGDSGQGDVAVGERLLADHPDHLDVVLIHDVVDTPASERADRAAQRIHFFDTYVGAAGVALAKGLVNRAGFDQVVAETHSGLDAVRWDSPAQERAVRDLVERDLGAVAST